MLFTENQIRDFLFANYKEGISSIIVGRKEPISWDEDGYPTIRFLLQQKAEKRIGEILDNLEDITLIAKELRLEKEGDNTTRIDLLGNSESTGLTIIELKKSKQTERQAFTELLAYANHFTSIFPGLGEKSITSILIAPMESRTVRDAFAQELLSNDKTALALIPKEINGQIQLSVYYPDISYYQWFENRLLDDRSMLAIAVSFPVVEGWIDTDFDSDDGEIPRYTKEALNTISSTISHKLEANGFHSLAYASQKWGSIAQTLPHPNTIFVVVINPFSAFRTSVDENAIYGESEDGRLAGIQSIHDQLSDDGKEFWIETLEGDFCNRLIRTIRAEFELCTFNSNKLKIFKEISLQDWYGIKTSIIDGVCTHNLDIFTTGLLRDIYHEYVKYVYNTKNECLHFGEDLPQYSYEMLRTFFPVWQILSALGMDNQDETD